MRVWRLVKSRYASTAFDGEGARLYGARWNRPGLRATYAADSPALAVLEVLVHVGDASLLSAYSLITASLPDAVIEDLDPSLLFPGWDSWPPPPRTQAIGNEWLHSGRSLALRIPSVLVPDSTNLILNPNHKDFKTFHIESIQPYRFDRRLIR